MLARLLVSTLAIGGSGRGRRGDPSQAPTTCASTVHVSHILSKLGMQSRTQAALYAVRMGLVAGASRQEQPIGRTH